MIMKDSPYTSVVNAEVSKEVTLSTYKCGKTVWQPGLCPDPAGELTALPTCLADGRGSMPLPKNPSPLSALRASILGSSGVPHFSSWRRLWFFQISLAYIKYGELTYCWCKLFSFV